VAIGNVVPDGESLLRRFDPLDDTHWSADESGGKARLRSGNFKWDPVPEDGPTMLGLSVYRLSKLQEVGLSAIDCLEHPTWDVAAIATETVRRVERSTVPPPSPRPFDAVEDEYPDGPEGAHLRDSAHALIVHELGLTKPDKWYRELAMRFQPLST
jgi:hypothetical protein